MKTPRVLLTGFEPFLGEPINPSQILLESIKKDLLIEQNVKTLLLPVSFARASELIEAELAANVFDHVILLGQAGGRKNICLERVALNWNETEKPDEDGKTPARGEIIRGQPGAIFTQAPIEKWYALLKDQNVPVEISLSAGGYVCNNVYYKTVSSNLNAKSVCFIHVPFLPEQVENKVDKPASLDLSTMELAIKTILNSIIRGS